MSDKMDIEDRNHAYRRTEETLWNTLLKLIKTKLPENIKAKELIRESGINQSTFYSHYPGGIKEMIDA